MSEIRLREGERIIVTPLGHVVVYEPSPFSVERAERELEFTKEFFARLRRLES